MAETSNARSLQPSYPDFRAWTGRIFMAVILGEAVWHLIVSLMDNVFVPWLGDVMGQSSGLPTSFIQRPYDYPDLFISILEACIAGIVAISVNWFMQRPVRRRVQVRTTTTTLPPLEETAIAPVVAQPAVVPVVQAPPQPTPVPVPRPVPVDAIVPPAPAPIPKSAPPPVAAVVPPPVVTKPAPAPPPAKVQPAKKKEVYYNIVGDPVSDDD